MSGRGTRSRRIPDTATLSLFDASAAPLPADDRREAATPGVTLIDPAHAALAEGFAERVVRWAEQLGAPAAGLGLVRNAAQAVSLATSSGHACIELGAIAPKRAEREALRSALLASNVVGTAADVAVAPLVLDDDDRLYLQRYFEYERRIARCIATRSAPALDPSALARLRTQLRDLFGPPPRGSVDRQRVAACMAVLNGFTVISGGPGTGKTTTVVNLLACLVALDPDCRIALAAPTGKAAARMQDALRRRASHLPESLRTRLPDESFTVHRLLGATNTAHTFAHDRDNPLPYDVVVIDEASMLDLALAAKLFDAIPRGSRIVLLGDKDQLAAVESGAVFSELSADPQLTAAYVEQLASLIAIDAREIESASTAERSALPDCVMWLIENFRFASDSGIGRLARTINAGDVHATLESLRSVDAGVVWLDDAAWALETRSLEHLTRPYEAYMCLIAQGTRDPSVVFEAFDRQRILCAQREGPRGVQALNDLLGRRCRDAAARHWPVTARSPWYAGRPVLIDQNDYVLKLYNGDVGIALPDPTGNLLVYFRATDGALRAIAPMRLPPHETAFAMTVHKAQGSEFDAIALVLPARPSPLLTRELLYTAITRARTQVSIVGSEEVLAQAIRTATIRHSGLHARLRDVQDELRTAATGTILRA